MTERAAGWSGIAAFSIFWVALFAFAAARFSLESDWVHRAWAIAGAVWGRFGDRH